MSSVSSSLKIKNVLDTEEYIRMTPSEMELLAKIYFKDFDDDDLKIRYLTECYKKIDSSKLSMTPDKCAKFLVECGSFEGGGDFY